MPSRWSPAESATSRPPGPTTITRPRTSFAALAVTSSRPSRVRSSSSSVTAMSWAWLTACDFTSAPTRSRMLMMSGTSSATTASTST